MLINAKNTITGKTADLEYNSIEEAKIHNPYFNDFVLMEESKNE